jgi:hypothetical protein
MLENALKLCERVSFVNSENSKYYLTTITSNKMLTHGHDSQTINDEAAPWSRRRLLFGPAMPNLGRAFRVTIFGVTHCSKAACACSGQALSHAPES